MNFYHTFLRLCHSVNKSPSAVAQGIGTSRAAVSRWKNGCIPSDVTMLKLADYFGVSMEYLKGEKELPATDNGNEELNFKGIGYGSEGISESRADSEVLASIAELAEISCKLKLEQIKALINIAKNMQ